ncbi:MAG: fumarylacetoacetate hydrolase [Chloroflexi bacterium]|nr:fumarylacetoacetate hydrolase [Chloroflexota bacterium]
MKLVQFNDYRLGVAEDDSVYDITGYLPNGEAQWGPIRMVRLVEGFDQVRDRLADDLSAHRLSPAKVERYLPPLTRPDKVVGAPVNYNVHRQSYPDVDKYTIKASGWFLKAPSAIVGPSDAIRIPREGVVNYEGELCLVIGKTASDVSAADAMPYIFGYTAMLDLTFKNSDGRSTRKSWDTFAPAGPCIVTADEIADPQNLGVHVWIDGELVQDYCTDDMIFPIPELIEFTSGRMALLPGDLFTTGNGGPSGALKDGQTVKVAIDGIGEMSLPVRYR